MNLEEFAKKYGNKGATIILLEAAMRLDDFPEAVDLAKNLGELAADIEQVIKGRNAPRFT